MISNDSKASIRVLRKLGGKATTRDISNLAKLKYPDSGFDNRGVAHKLTRLQMWGHIQHLESTEHGSLLTNKLETISMQQVDNIIMS
jgi:hypothetical protein